MIVRARLVRRPHGPPDGHGREEVVVEGRGRHVQRVGEHDRAPGGVQVHDRRPQGNARAVDQRSQEVLGLVVSHHLLDEGGRQAGDRRAAIHRGHRGRAEDGAIRRRRRPRRGRCPSRRGRKPAEAPDAHVEVVRVVRTDVRRVVVDGEPVARQPHLLMDEPDERVQVVNVEALAASLDREGRVRIPERLVGVLRRW